MKYATIGTISHGTLRNEDLLDAFAGELEYQVSRNAEAWASDEGRMQRDELMNVIWMAREIEDYNSDEASESVEGLFQALELFAAPYCYFGALEGDGSDFGFWPAIEALEEAAQQEELLKVADSSEIPEDYSGEVMLVNDHGNVTFGVAENGKFREIWGCV